MAEPKWGEKRVCLSCGARFYDMLRSPIICPKCEIEFLPVVSSRGSRLKAAAPVPVPERTKPAAEKKTKLDLLADDGGIPDHSGIGILDDDELVEDTIDLGAEDNVLEGIDSTPKKSDDLIS